MVWETLFNQTAKYEGEAGGLSRLSEPSLLAIEYQGERGSWRERYA